MKRTTLGVIFGNRDFFPDHLVTSARADIASLRAAHAGMLRLTRLSFAPASGRGRFRAQKEKAS